MIDASYGFMKDGPMLGGNVDTGKAVLRGYIKATVGLEKLGKATDTQPRASSICLALRNPRARNLFGVIGYLQSRQAFAACLAPASVVRRYRLFDRQDGKP